MEPVLNNKNTVGLSSVADMHNFDGDLDPSCHFYVDPDPTLHSDPDSIHWLVIECKLMRIRIQIITLVRIRNGFCLSL